jgi:hypothetical protein
LTIVGDIDGDGLAELLVGDSHYDAFKGGAYLIYGPVPSGDYLLDDHVDAVFGGGSGDTAGRSVAGGGDFDGDGSPDFMVSAQRANSDDGRVYVLYGG